uniref:Uncharacterized protein n=1 Tax=Timema cristinae TaxID=61476 RepID=A0A7R9D8I5_TIMCR|nr:unnamed protein product [Timema cristinae]
MTSVTWRPLKTSAMGRRPPHSPLEAALLIIVDEDVAECGKVTDVDIVTEALNNNIQAEDGASDDEEDNFSVVQERSIPSAAVAMDHISDFLKKL